MARRTTEIREKPNGNGNGEHKLNAEELRTDIDAMMACRENVASKNQAVGTLAKKLEDKGYNKKGFNLLVTMAKMSDENRNDFVRFLQFGFEAMGWDEVPDLLDGADDANGKATKDRIAGSLNH